MALSAFSWVSDAQVRTNDLPTCADPKNDNPGGAIRSRCQVQPSSSISRFHPLCCVVVMAIGEVTGHCDGEDTWSGTGGLPFWRSDG